MKNKDVFEIIRSELKLYDLNSVAEAAGISYSTLDNWIKEKNGCNLTTVTKVAKVLGYNIEIKVIKQ